MTLKLRKTDASLAPMPAEHPTTTISSWLAMVSGMLPRGQAQAIRDEIETHLTDRVRDLMVGGMTENEATKRAIAEFGEAADMAAKYRAVQSEPQRRLLMYGSIFAACGAALALSIAAITGAGGAGGARTQPPVRTAQGVPVLSDIPVIGALYQKEDAQPGEQGNVKLAVTFLTQPASKEIADVRFDANFKDASAADAFEFIGKVVNKPVNVNWKSLEELQVHRDARINLQAKHTGIEAVLRAASESSNVTGAKIDWRLTDGVLEIASREFFDVREIRLTIYDISPIIAARIETYNEERAKIVEEVTMLLREFVYPEGWRDNGGALARLTVVGDRMFVEAPERYHTQIKWMLDQLPSSGKHVAASPLPLKRYALKYTNSTEVMRVIKDTFGPGYLSGVGLASDDRTNTVIVSGGEQVQREVSEVIAKLDVDGRAKEPGAGK